MTLHFVCKHHGNCVADDDSSVIINHNNNRKQIWDSLDRNCRRRLPASRHETAFKYVTRAGTLEAFNITKECCTPFGFYFGERVKVTDADGSSKSATVIGVRGNNLYFHIDGDLGASYYQDFKMEEFQKRRFVRINESRKSANKASHYAPDLSSLLEDPDATFSDVTLQVGTASIRAHKNILMARSLYFRSMFTVGMRESRESVVTIQNMEEDVFRSVMEFIYAGSVQITKFNITSLVEASQMLQIEDLADECCAAFPVVAFPDNVVDLFILSNYLPKLKLLCLNFMWTHYQEVVSSPHFKKLVVAEHSDLLLELIRPLGAVEISLKNPQPCC